jgi:hypothetical protein
VRQTDFIFVEGVNGDSCCISPPGLSWGPELAPGSTGLFDMPVQVNWGSYAFGQFYQSWKPKRRDVVWTIHVRNPDTGSLIDPDADLWHTVYSRWRAMFAVERETVIRYVSLDGERTLGVRTLDTPKSFSTQNFEGKDPHLFAYGSIVQSQAAELPFYVGKPDIYSYEIPSGSTGDFWFTLPYHNPGSVDIWPEAEISGGATWILPDYSFGNEAYGRGAADMGKTVPIPTLLPGENVSVRWRPDLEWLLSEWETPVTNRSPGLRHEYPIPPGEGSADEAGTGAGCVVRALNVVNGAAIVLTLPRWYAEPFSTPRVA